MSVAHRGDHKNYPENSIEGCLSAILAGADIVEVDVAKTKDGVLILMHDDSLTRTTNVATVRKSNSNLPETNNVSDWTLEQLSQLKLLNGNGGSGATVSNCSIPTLEDVIKVCNNRVFITLDKMERFDWTTDIMPLLAKHVAYRTVMLPYTYTDSLGFSDTNELMKEIKQLSGYQSALMSRVGSTNDLITVSLQINLYSLPKVLRCGEYNATDTTKYNSYFGNYRIHIECLETSNDTLDMWRQIDNEGYGIIVTNDICGLTKYIEDTYVTNN